MADVIKALEAKPNEKVPTVKAGDNVSVHVKIKEGERERIQEFKGTVIRTRKGHRLFFDDGTRGEVTLQLNDGKKLTLDDDGIVLDDGQGNKLSIQTAQGSMTLEAANSLTLKAPRVKIDATGTLDLNGSATATLKGGVVNIN